MKRILLYSIIASFALLFACDPIEDRDSIGGAISADQLKISATPIVINGKNTNKVVLNSQGNPVLSLWNFGIGKTLNSLDTVTLAILGRQTMTFTGLNPDGTKITKTVDVTVDELYFPVDPIYGLLFGSGEKKWIWASAKCFGNGGPSETGPAWWILNPEDLAAQFDGKKLPADGKGAYMTLNINGLKLSKTTADGKTTNGEMSWSTTDGVTKIKLYGVNILGGYDFNDSKYSAWSEYTVVSLTSDKMVLKVQEHSPNSNWWYYVFVPQSN